MEFTRKLSDKVSLEDDTILGQMKVIDLAVIIPTLNEEDYVGELLDSIAFQTVQPKEVIVVDAQSEDKTKEVVIKRKKVLPCLKFFAIPKHTISKQRNFGVRKTSAKHLLFLDADMELRDKQTLEKYLQEVERKKPDIAAADNLPRSSHWKDAVFFNLQNNLLRVSKPVWPMATTQNMYVKRPVFNSVKGFDERVAVGEDHDLVQRIVKKGGKFVLLHQPKLYTSVRRFVKEGRRKFALKMIYSFFYIVRHGYAGIPIEYEFGKFGKGKGKGKYDSKIKMQNSKLKSMVRQAHHPE